MKLNYVKNGSLIGYPPEFLAYVLCLITIQSHMFKLKIIYFFVEHSLSGNNSVEFLLNEKYCTGGTVMGPLVTNASPFLFPCTIEYSLICAVILFEIWKKVKMEETKEADKKNPRTNSSNSPYQNKVDRLVTTHFHFSKF